MPGWLWPTDSRLFYHLPVHRSNSPVVPLVLLFNPNLAHRFLYRVRPGSPLWDLLHQEFPKELVEDSGGHGGVVGVVYRFPNLLVQDTRPFTKAAGELCP
jgi:hypothetical protein